MRANLKNECTLWAVIPRNYCQNTTKTCLEFHLSRQDQSPLSEPTLLPFKITLLRSSDNHKLYTRFLYSRWMSFVVTGHIKISWHPTWELGQSRRSFRNPSVMLWCEGVRLRWGRCLWGFDLLVCTQTHTHCTSYWVHADQINSILTQSQSRTSQYSQTWKL